MGGEMITVCYQGSKFIMTEKEIEAAYRYRKRQYQISDCRAHLEDMAFGESAECVEGGEEILRRAEFLKEYGMEYSEVLNLIDVMVDKYDDCHDCNLAENDMWESVIKDVIEENRK